MDINSFIAGFVEGEGCFCISFSKREKLSTGIEVRPSFSVSQHKRSLALLQKIHKIFGCGTIRFSNGDQTYKFEVRSITDLHEVVIPFFEQSPLLGAKANDFEIFKNVCEMIRANHHLNSDKLKEIIALSYQINCSGKRKYKAEELLRYMGKMKI